jgi:hypothetical protein
MFYIHEKKPYSIEFNVVYHSEKKVTQDKYFRSIVTTWKETETFCTVSNEKWSVSGFTLQSYKDRDVPAYARAIAFYRALLNAEKLGYLTGNEVYAWTFDKVFSPWNKKRYTWRKFMSDACRKSES